MKFTEMMLRLTRVIFIRLMNQKMLFWLPDKPYLKLRYRLRFHKKLNLHHPQTFDEKLMWLMLYDRNPLYTQFVDKYRVREYIAEKLGEEYLIPLLGVWDRSEDIDFSALPDKFVLKCNHDYKSVIICKDKNAFDFDFARKKLKKCLKTSLYKRTREWPYKNVKPKIIAEEYLGDNLYDYKICCFNGKPDNVIVCTGRQKGDLRFYYFDLDWHFLRINTYGLNAPDDFTLPKPENLDEMIRIAEQCSRDTYFLRVDLYSVHHRVYFGELTFFPSAGVGRHHLPQTNIEFGDKLKLPFRK